MISLGSARSRLVTDPSFEVKRCTRCQAPIVWATTEKGRRMPVDVPRTAGGNLLLYAELVAPDELLPGYRVRSVSPEERKQLGGTVWISHFATCNGGDAYLKACGGTGEEG